MKLTDRQKQVLRGVRPTAETTSAIAQRLREETHWIRSPLLALERKGLVLCVSRGSNGTSSRWETTPAGRTALAETLEVKG